MKLLKNIPQNKYNDVNWVLNYLHFNSNVGEEDTEPIEYFHCFWKGGLTDLHLMCLDSLKKHHPTSKVLLWTTNALEIQGTLSWMKIKRLLKENIQIIEVTNEHFKEAKMDVFYSKFVLLTSKNRLADSYNHDLAYASDITRFMVLNLYGGVWFDMDVLFLRNLDSIKLKRFVSQWGTDWCGNGALLKLEKGHNLVNNMSKFNTPFYPTTSFKLENDIDLTILPSTFFDILWRPSEEIPEHIQFKTFKEFFEVEQMMLPTELYAYHWHNQWERRAPTFYK